MKYQPGFTDFFMSPVTGRIILPMIPDLTQNYVWLGDRNDRPLPSPIILDLRLEIINLRNRLSTTRFILQAASPNFDNSQALNELYPGILRHDDGIVSTQHLTHTKIWVGDEDNWPVESDLLNEVIEDIGDININIESIFDHLLEIDIHLGDIDIELGDININIESIFDSLFEINIELGDINIDIESLFELVTDISVDFGDIIIRLDGLDDIVADLQVQIDTNVASGLDHLADLQLQIDTNVASGLDALATINIRLDALELSITDILTTISSILSDITSIFSTLSTIATQITSILSDITAINASIVIIQEDIVAIYVLIETINTAILAIDASILTIQGDITTIFAAIATIEGDITSILASILAIEGDITNITTVLLPAVYTYIDTEITNITNNFIAGGVIDMDDNRIINLPCDPVEDNDAISFCFLWHVLHDEVTVSWS